MQMSHLRPGFLRAGSAPAKLLFQETEDFFDLLAQSVVPLQCARRKLRVIGHKVASPVFDDHHLMLDLTQATDCTPKAMRPSLSHDLPLEQAVRFESGDILPTKAFK